ncbi:MAG: carbohydrate kinase family protein [Lachnospiraceae bacterium]|nr:carbohydrate kinase family protein [Lachnospiraceae bacterium]
MSKKAVVAGHICIDITPAIPKQKEQKIQNILVPGTLINVGNADIHTGGSVANTGLAMKILGADVTLAGKIGNDEFGNMVSSIIDKYEASSGLIRSKGDSTSYSVVLAIPGVDRIFLHNPGANDTFSVEDLPTDAIKEAALFHFGYPPLMKKIYENEGAQLVEIMRSVKEEGAATSLDFAAVDPNTEAGKADWKKILKKTLPYVDIFVPSVEELMFMLDKEKYKKLRDESVDRDFTEIADIDRDIKPLGELCLNMGAGIVLIKCGAAGMYYCTGDRESVKKSGERLELNPEDWAGRSGFEKSFKPDRVLSGTGAGDTSVAAFLTSVLNGNKPEECVRYAAATGACCVAAYDALSGIKSFEEIDVRLSKGWEKV